VGLCVGLGFILGKGLCEFDSFFEDEEGELLVCVLRLGFGFGFDGVYEGFGAVEGLGDFFSGHIFME